MVDMIPLKLVLNSKDVMLKVMLILLYFLATLASRSSSLQLVPVSKSVDVVNCASVR